MVSCGSNKWFVYVLWILSSLRYFFFFQTKKKTHTKMVTKWMFTHRDTRLTTWNIVNHNRNISVIQFLGCFGKYIIRQTAHDKYMNIILGRLRQALCYISNVCIIFFLFRVVRNFVYFLQFIRIFIYFHFEWNLKGTYIFIKNKFFTKNFCFAFKYVCNYFWSWIRTELWLQACFWNLSFSNFWEIFRNFTFKFSQKRFSIRLFKKKYVSS